MDDMAKQCPSLFYVNDLYNKDWVKHHIKKSGLVFFIDRSSKKDSNVQFETLTQTHDEFKGAHPN